MCNPRMHLLMNYCYQIGMNMVSPCPFVSYDSTPELFINHMYLL